MDLFECLKRDFVFFLFFCNVNCGLLINLFEFLFNIYLNV